MRKLTDTFMPIKCFCVFTSMAVYNISERITAAQGQFKVNQGLCFYYEIETRVQPNIGPTM